MSLICPRFKPRTDKKCCCCESVTLTFLVMGSRTCKPCLDDMDACTDEELGLNDNDDIEHGGGEL